MRQFLKLVTSSCLGTILAFLTLFLIIMFIGLSNEPQITTPNNSVLHIKLDGITPELTDNVMSSPYDFEAPTSIGLNDIARLIRKAKTDDKIKGILLQTEECYLNTTAALYIATVLDEFKSSGKFIHAYGHYFTQSGFVIASVADSIFLNPNGFIDLKGFGVAIPYLKNFSSKSKIEFDVYYAGKYKSAIEPYYRSESSEENRFQTKEYLMDYQNSIVEIIAKNRSIPAEMVSDIIINYKADFAERALELKLVDHVMYWGEFEERLGSIINDSSPEYVTLGEYLDQNPIIKKSADHRIAVLYAEGTIAHTGENKGEVSMDRYNQWLDKIENNKKIKALVLRVNSPGGSAFTSDLFWKRIEDIKKSGKIVIASFGTYAASGGYYIACGADKIVSEPTTLTGSIGVFSMIPNLNKFFEHNLGINWDTISTSNHAFIYSLMTQKSDVDNIKLMNNTERIYAQFLDKVASGRGMTIEEVNEIAQGRVWSGLDAIKIGLVDTLGTLDNAIEIAADLSGLSEYRLLQYPVIKKSFYEELISDVLKETNAQSWLNNSSSIDNKLSKELMDYINYIESSCETPQARLPFSILDN